MLTDDMTAHTGGTELPVSNSSNSNSNSSITDSPHRSPSQKYDRQLRLWGSMGQYHVSHTCIVVLNIGTAVATETMKNCILPGIQHIHIMDMTTGVESSTTTHSVTSGKDATVKDTTEHDIPMNHSDYSSNFFLTQNNHNHSHSTTSRAAMALQYLLELNPDVTGSYDTYHNDNDDAVTTNQNHHHNNNNASRIQHKLQQLQSMYERVIVFGTDLDQTTIQNITQIISSLSSSSSSNNNNHYKNDIPFLTVHSYGLMGIYQIQYLPLHPIMNPTGGSGGSGNSNQNTATNATTLPDLRLYQPFPILKEYMESFIETHFATTMTETTSPILSTHEYGNIPYPILLYYAYHYTWKRQYPQINKPMTMEQKKEFQGMIQQHYYETTSSTTSSSTTTTTNRRNDLPTNVQEAIQNSYLAYTERTVDRTQLQSLLEKMTLYQQQHPMMNRECMKFYTLLHAIDQFMTMGLSSPSPSSSPPVHGTIPDMTASTNAYIELQSIYKQQCRIDIALLRTYMQQHQQQQSNAAWNAMDDSGKNNSDDMNAIMDDEYIRTFCFNINNIDIVICHNINNRKSKNDPSNDIDTEHMKSGDEGDDENDDIDKNKNIESELSEILDDFTYNDESEDVQIPLLWYICYEACQLFYEKVQRYPGTFNIDPNTDIDIKEEEELLFHDAKQLQTYIVQLLQQDPRYVSISTHPVIQRTLLQPYPNITTDDDDNGPTTETTLNNADDDHPSPSKYAVEMVRYGNCEIHTIASILGGIAAQEIMKIITYQYVPLQNTYVYNGITSTGAVYTV